jgi:hypothetical protein
MVQKRVYSIVLYIQGRYTIKVGPDQQIINKK